MFSTSRRCLAVLVAIALLLAGPASHLFGYALEGPIWPTGSTINIQLAFTRPISGSLQDGFADFNASATDALALWNQHMDLVRLNAIVTGIPGSKGDGRNNAFFSSTLYGMSFGGALATTVYFTDGSTISEADNLFNAAFQWDSYRGPAQYNSKKKQYVYDFHRVALHEFGHTLGLDHPDDYGQIVTAIMNSHASDIDQLQVDDITGVRSIYGALITSSLNPPGIPVGSNFSYQITTNFNSTSYSASGLPSGLHLDPTSGLISGTPAVSGNFNVSLTVSGAFRPGVATLVIRVAPPAITSSLTPFAVDIGSGFSYHVTATGLPTSFDAVNIPSGMTFDRATGVLNGVPNLSGTYRVAVTAHTPYGNATAVVVFVINPLPTFDQPAVTFPFGDGPILADAARRRVYVGDFAKIEVFQTDPLPASIDQVGALYNLNGDMSLSPDNNTLWFGYEGNKIGRLDLNNLTLLPDPQIPLQKAGSVREGVNHQLFVADLGAGGVAQIDLNTGTLIRRFDSTPPGSNTPNYCRLTMSPDFNILYVSQSSPAAGIHKWDVSSGTPHLLQTASQSGGPGNIAVSHNGQLISFATSGDARVTNVFSSSDITQPIGQLNFLQKNSSTATFSVDDSLIFQSTSVSGNLSGIAVFDAANQALVRAIRLPPGLGIGLVAIDSSDAYIFASPSYDGRHWLAVYDLRPPAFGRVAKSLVNVSTRVMVGANGNVEIGGFILSGTRSKLVIVRAIAPSLTQFGVTGAMSDPVLELHDSTGGILITNDNWNADRQNVLNTGYAPPDEHEAAIVTRLSPGSYTAILRGVKNNTGVALFELYDLDPQSSTISNLSTRGNVGVGNDVMIGGFVVGGSQPTNVIVRALGPALTDFGVTGALADPTLELHDSNGALIAQNDNWKSDQQAAIQNSGYAPPKDAEAAILMTLQPGNYTAVVHGANNTTGIGLVEVYNLDTN